MEKHQATFGSGCFWCTEAVFQQIKGVSNVMSGYMGGHLDHPTYEAVCGGNTGHAEVIHFEYDPQEVSFEELLLMFFKTHDPTTLNRQGNDRGTQYRSVIFYYDDEQRSKSEALIEQLNADGVFKDPIVTEVVPVEKFYPAEVYHHNYYQNNPHQSYCMYVIQPKLNKFITEFKNRLA